MPAAIAFIMHNGQDLMPLVAFEETLRRLVCIITAFYAVIFIAFAVIDGHNYRKMCGDYELDT
ncbi:MAG: hypothetical protein ACU88J_12965 [Gammaproteobacteria bacterium]